ncbi:MAG: hypothetical protein RLZZ385_639 [Pseudomonadota bacterium]|jgi:2-C-methyl-D-erythritol 2,4-cyclodiphosphate synthase
MKLQDMRIGHGYDAHRFATVDSADNKPLMLAGIRVPYERGLLAHSDGDVVIHALCDALLGSLAAGDIGHHFPDHDEQYRNIDSSLLLSEVMQLVQQGHWQVINVDLTILAQVPKLAPHMQAMRERLAGLLHTSTDRVNIKATTTEGMGFVGRKEGIASYAVVLLGRLTPQP